VPKQLTLDSELCGALFSPCRTWRYSLWRFWGVGERRVAFIGLNPSTADEQADDPTIRRCIDFAKRWGFDGLYMLNLFALRSTDPRGLDQVDDPVGPANDDAIAAVLAQVDLAVAAWGVHGWRHDRDQRFVAQCQRELHCLGRTINGHPKHPLYLRATTELVLFHSPVEATP
jgi:hypothetical protein